MFCIYSSIKILCGILCVIRRNWKNQKSNIYAFVALQITRSDTGLHVKWADSTETLDIHINLPQGFLCVSMCLSLA